MQSTCVYDQMYESRRRERSICKDRSRCSGSVVFAYPYGKNGVNLCILDNDRKNLTYVGWLCHSRIEIMTNSYNFLLNTFSQNPAGFIETKKQTK